MGYAELVIKTAVSQSQDGLNLLIEFNSATGAYDAGTNPGGFGTPNPERNTLAAIFYANHEREVADILAAPVAHDPLTVSSFTVPVSAKNGVFHYYLWLIQLYDDQESPVEGMIRYDNEAPATPFLKKYTSGAWTASGVVTSVSLISEPALALKEGYEFPFPEMIDYRNSLEETKLIKLKARLNAECGRDDYENIRNDFEYVDGSLDSATLDFCAGVYAAAQETLEDIELFKTNKEAA